MLTIKRTCANKIITRVLSAGDRPFTAVLKPGADDCIFARDGKTLQAMLDQNAGAFIVYNQHPEAQDYLHSLVLDEHQIIIEVRQETRGVLGLQARYCGSAPDDFIELVYSETL